MPGTPTTSGTRKEKGRNSNNNNNRLVVTNKEARNTKPLHKSRLVIQGFEDPEAGTQAKNGNVTVQVTTGALARPSGDENGSTWPTCLFTLLIGFLLGQRRVWTLLGSIFRSRREPQAPAENPVVYRGPDSWLEWRHLIPSAVREPPRTPSKRQEDIEEAWNRLTCALHTHSLRDPAVRIQRAHWHRFGKVLEDHEWARNLRARTLTFSRKTTTKKVYKPRSQ
jgi:hypothetical protein